MSEMSFGELLDKMFGPTDLTVPQPSPAEEFADLVAGMRDALVERGFSLNQANELVLAGLKSAS